MSTSSADVIGGLLADEMSKMQGESQAFLAQQAAQTAQSKSIMDAMIARMAEPRQQPGTIKLTPEIQEIVAVLTAQPRLIPFVQIMLKAKVAELNAAIDQILGVASPPPASQSEKP